jgi:ribosome biogenesis GTPase / thiamine phosphate phosphatase
MEDKVKGHKYSLEQLGWNSNLNNQLTSSSNTKDDLIGRIISINHSIYTVISEQAELLTTLDGKLQFALKQSKLEMPAVGDWVIIKNSDQQSPLITNVLNRFSSLHRSSCGKKTDKQVIAANIDYIFIVSGLDQDFNIRRLERYVTMAWESGAQPVLLLNKSDIIDKEQLLDIQYQVECIAPGVTVHMISALKNNGIDQLTQYLQTGKTIVLIGSSGCGKSTLVNQLSGKNLQKTNAIRESDGRGRHTTVRRDLFILKNGGIIIDNPGLREIQLYAEQDALDMTFADIEGFTDNCKFKDCSHQSEPGCAVQQALLDGELKPDRYASYLKLQKELNFLQNRKLGKKSHFHKSISKFAKELKKHKKQIGEL